MSEDIAPNVIQLAKTRYEGDDLARAAAFLEVPKDHPDLLPFLGTALDLNLDPFRQEIWMLPADDFRAADGAVSETRYAPYVGRDGLLKKARETQGFKAVRGLAVCEFDEFSFTDTGDDVTVHHSAELPKPDDSKDDPSKWRGRVIGAWAKLFMEDRPSLFFYAPIHEFGPEGLDLYADTIEDRYWKYLSTMMLKAAQSYVLRIGIGATGFVPMDELRPEPLAMLTDGVESMEAEVLRIIHTELKNLPKELVSDLDEAIAEANSIERASWNPTKVRMRLVGQNEKVAREVLGEVLGEIEKWKQSEGKPVEPVLTDIKAGELQTGMTLATKQGDMTIGHVHHTAKMVLLQLYPVGEDRAKQAPVDSRKHKDKIVQIRETPEA